MLLCPLYTPLLLSRPTLLSASSLSISQDAVPPCRGGRGWPPLFYDVSIPLFLTEASGLWSDTNHYICMVLFCILNELKHFGICNDDLLLPDNNPILFPALHCYLQKLLRFNIKVFNFVSRASLLSAKIATIQY